ncbi:MAG: AAA-like domain-containing protein, partial [Desulfamplus sp.]|nr:AAA-like domain-containing protein [Desulfamplus sp.]
MRFFNTAGPVNCNDHYYLQPLERFNLPEILNLIEQKKYFILHAPRQTGKTSSLLALMKYLNDQGTYKCLYINVEVAQSARKDVFRGIRAILAEMAAQSEYLLKDDFIQNLWFDILNKNGADFSLKNVLMQWCMENEKPIILLIDEIDALIGDTLISVLRQLRSGYTNRPKAFPQSIILCGLRDVRDYRIHSSREKAIITGGSAFNIKAESLKLGDFSKQEIEQLYTHHTEETGQIFESKAIDMAYEYSDGQPWIVNALAYEVCFKMEEGKNRATSITPEMIRNAAERLILRRETHI